MSQDLTTHPPERYGRAFFVLLAFCLLSTAVTLVLVFDYLNQRRQLEQAAFASASSQASAAAADINTAFSTVMTIADDIAAALSSGELAYNAIHDRLAAEVAAHPDIDGLAITFQPFAYDPDLRLYQTYYYKTVSGDFDILDGATYDYSIPPTGEPDSPATGWYHNPLNNGAIWNEPFMATGAGKILIEYGVPFFTIDPELPADTPAGVVTIDYSLQDMRDLMAAMELGTTGYGYVIATSGTFLAHPVDEFVARSTIFQQAATLEDSALAQAAAQALAGESFVLERRDTLTGEISWMFFEPIPATNWALGLVLNQAEFLPDSRTTLRQQITIALSTALSLFFASTILFRADRGTNRALWSVAIAFSLLGTGVIALTWYLSTTITESDGVPVTNQTTVQRYLENHIASNNTTPIIIPTGIYLDALQFPDPTSVTVNGYIWQRYGPDVPEDFIEGLVLLQTTGEEVIIEEVLTEEQGDETVVLYYIGLSLRQSYDTRSFPFDRRRITVRIAPLDLRQNIVLVPDLGSYSLLNPRLLPGLDSGVNLYSWHLESSSFNYQTAAFNTNFGLQSRTSFTNPPELVYTVNVRRNFLGPFIAYLLPGVVAAGMMFAFLLSDRRSEGRDEIVTTLNYSAALFFVIAVAHTALRDNVAAVGLTYMEHLYILLYISIITVAINTFLVVKRPDFALIRYRNNLLPRLLYWPVIVGVMLLSTLVIFVYT